MLETTHSYTDVLAAGGPGQVVNIDFQFFGSDHIDIVTIDDDDVETNLMAGIDYLIVEPVAPLPNTSTVTISKSLTAGHTIRVRRVVPNEQPIHLITQGNFTAASIEKALDLLEMQIQQALSGILQVTPFVHGNLGGDALHALADADHAGFLGPSMYSAIVAHIGEGGAGAATHPLASEIAAGFLSSEDFLRLQSTRPYETTEAMTLYVDLTNGDDEGDGSTLEPMLTVDEAWLRVPLIVKHNVTINIVGGDGTRKTVEANWSFAPLIVSPAILTIQCTEYLTVEGLDGAATGAFTSSSGYSHTMGSAAWSANEVRGYFFEMTSGALAGNRYAIDSNTTDTVQASIVSGSISGGSFRIVEPAVVLDPEDNSLYGITFGGLGANAAAFVIRGFTIDGGTRGVRWMEVGTLRDCRLMDQTVFSLNGSLCKDASIDNCYVQAASGANAARCFTFDAARQMTHIGTVMRGPGNTGTSAVGTARETASVIMGSATRPCFYRNSNTGMTLRQARVSTGRAICSDFTSTAVLIQQCQAILTDWEIVSAGDCVTINPASATDFGGTTYLQLSGGTYECGAGQSCVSVDKRCQPTQVHLRGNVVLTSTAAGGSFGVRSTAPSTFVRVEDAHIEDVIYGVMLEQGADNSTVHVSFPGLAAGATRIGDITFVGICVRAAHCNVIVFDDAEIENCGTCGVVFEDGAAFCNFQSHADLSMSGNGGGSADLQIAEGVSPITIAALRADGDKTIPDATRFNRLFEP